MIYFDNAATTFPKPECVYSYMDYVNRNMSFNAGRGEYKESNEAYKLIDDARNKVGRIVGKRGKAVVFSSSATEALNQIIYGLSLSHSDSVFVSPFEHNAVVRPLYNLVREKGIEVKQIPFDTVDWNLKKEEFENELTVYKPKAVFVSQISNVTGYEIPYEEIFGIAKGHKAITILDASQGFGVKDIRESENIDYIIFAGHKSLYGQFGVGGFVALRDGALSIVKAGGTGSDSLNTSMPFDLPYKFEAGSYNVVAISSLCASIDWLKNKKIYEEEKALTEYLISRLSEMDNIHMYIPKNGNIFGIVSITVDDYSPTDIGNILYDEYGIAVRTGFHCAPFIHKFLGTVNLGGTVRISLGAFNNKDDVDILMNALKSL